MQIVHLPFRPLQLLSHNHFSHLQMCFYSFAIFTDSTSHCLFAHGCRATSWIIDSPSDTTSLEKAGSTTPRSHRLPIVSLPEVEIFFASSLPARCLLCLVLILSVFCACWHKYYKFTCTHALLCPEKQCLVVVNHHLWQWSLSLEDLGGDCDINVQYKAEHSSISCSLHVGQLWVSALSIIMLNKEINTQSRSIIIKSQPTIHTLCIIVYCNVEVLARTVR